MRDPSLSESSDYELPTFPEIRSPVFSKVSTLRVGGYPPAKAFGERRTRPNDYPPPAVRCPTMLNWPFTRGIRFRRGISRHLVFEVSVEETFAAGHALRGYRGKCENPHGHNYRLRITLRGPQLDPTGLLYDFVHLKQVIHTVVESVDHKFLNDQPPFDVLNPSAENIAKYLYDEISRQMRGPQNGASIVRVDVWETDTSRASYWPDETGRG
jgi:6-pyruvoyltetrahydropterin/6-carboxytetrahydropterin synthase